MGEFEQSFRLSERCFPIYHKKFAAFPIQPISFEQQLTKLSPRNAVWTFLRFGEQAQVFVLLCAKRAQLFNSIFSIATFDLLPF